LNKIAIGNKFPIPIVEELLNELSRDIVSSKLDLKADYYQIRMRDEDVEEDNI